MISKLTESIFYNLRESNEVEKKVKEYKKYIKTHKDNVEKAWKIVKTIDNKYVQDNLEEIENNIKHHDESKYDGDEFDWYRKKYYPVSDEEANSVMDKIEDIFWLHYSKNPHHWEYWLDEDKKLDATKHSDEEIDNNVMIAYIEMLCDWASFGFKQNKPEEVRSWYISNKPTMTLWNNEQEQLEEILKDYIDIVKED